MFICVYLWFLCFAAVDGTVINKTTGKPQAGATVTLYKFGSAGMESVESVKSGAQAVSSTSIRLRKVRT